MHKKLLELRCDQCGHTESYAEGVIGGIGHSHWVSATAPMECGPREFDFCTKVCAAEFFAEVVGLRLVPAADKGQNEQPQEIKE